MDKPDFGVYHHSSREESENLRKISMGLFQEAFIKTGISRDDPIIIADIGCGLGFLEAVAADYFRNSQIIAIDKFSDGSLKQNSKASLENNLKLLGLMERVAVVEQDISQEILLNQKVDLAISNLVMHNLGKKRFNAYENIHKILKPGSYFLNADGFIARKPWVNPVDSDVSKIKKYFESDFILRPPHIKEGRFWIFLLIGLKAKSL